MLHDGNVDQGATDRHALTLANRAGLGADIKSRHHGAPGHRVEAATDERQARPRSCVLERRPCGFLLSTQAGEAFSINPSGLLQALLFLGHGREARGRCGLSLAQSSLGDGGVVSESGTLSGRLVGDVSQVGFLRLKLFQAEGLFCLGCALLITTLGFEGGQTAMFVGHRPGQLVLARHVSGHSDVVVGVGGLQGLLGQSFASGPLLLQGNEIVLDALTGAFKLGDGGARLRCLVDAASIEGHHRLFQGAALGGKGCELGSGLVSASVFLVDEARDVGLASVTFVDDGQQASPFVLESLAVFCFGVVDGALGPGAAFGEVLQAHFFIVGAGAGGLGGGEHFGIEDVAADFQRREPGFLLLAPLVAGTPLCFIVGDGSGSSTGEQLQLGSLFGQAGLAVCFDGLQLGFQREAASSEVLQFSDLFQLSTSDIVGQPLLIRLDVGALGRQTLEHGKSILQMLLLLQLQARERQLHPGALVDEGLQTRFLFLNTLVVLQLKGVQRLLHGRTLLSEGVQAAYFVGNAAIAFVMDGVEGRLGSDALFGDCTQAGGFISQQDPLGVSQCADGGFSVGTVISEPSQPGFFVGEALLLLRSQRFKGDLGSGSLVGEALQAALFVGVSPLVLVDAGLQGGLGAGADDGEGLQAGSAVLLVGVAGAVELGDGLLLLRSFIGERGNALLLFGDADRPLPGQACQFELGSDPSLPGLSQRHFLLGGGGISGFNDGPQSGGFSAQLLESFGSVAVVSNTGARSQSGANDGGGAEGHRRRGVGEIARELVGIAEATGSDLPCRRGVTEVVADVAGSVEAAGKWIAAAEVVVVVVAKQITREGGAGHNDAQRLGRELKEVVLVDGDHEPHGQIRRGPAHVGDDFGGHAGCFDRHLEKAVAAGNQGVGGGADPLGAGANEQDGDAGPAGGVAKAVAHVGGVFVDREQVDDDAGGRRAVSVEGGGGDPGVARHHDGQSRCRERLREGVKKGWPPRHEQYRRPTALRVPAHAAPVDRGKTALPAGVAEKSLISLVKSRRTIVPRRWARRPRNDGPRASSSPCRQRSLLRLVPAVTSTDLRRSVALSSLAGSRYLHDPTDELEEIATMKNCMFLSVELSPR